MRRRVSLESRDSEGGAGREWASVRSFVPSQPIAIEIPNRMISTSTPRVAMRNHQNSRSIVGWFSSLNDSSQAANQRCASSSETSEPMESAKTVPRTAKRDSIWGEGCTRLIRSNQRALPRRGRRSVSSLGRAPALPRTRRRGKTQRAASPCGSEAHRGHAPVARAPSARARMRSARYQPLNHGAKVG